MSIPHPTAQMKVIYNWSLSSKLDKYKFFMCVHVPPDMSHLFSRLFWFYGWQLLHFYFHLQTADNYCGRCYTPQIAQKSCTGSELGHGYRPKQQRAGSVRLTKTSDSHQCQYSFSNVGGSLFANILRVSTLYGINV